MELLVDLNLFRPSTGVNLFSVLSYLAGHLIWSAPTAAHL